MCGRGASTLSAERACRIAGGARVRGFGKARTRYNLGPQGYVPVVLNGAGGGGACAGGPEDGGKENDVKKGGREVTAMRWGLVPAFAKRLEDYDLFKGGSSTFNARVESLESSGLWRRLLDSKRCIVLLDGFYEWKTVGKNKTPMFIRHADSYCGRTIPSAAQQNEGNPYERKAAGLPPQAGKPVLPVQATQATQETNSSAANENENSERTPLMFAGLYDVWRRSEGETLEEPLESVTIITMDSEGTPVFKIHDRMPLLLTAETAAAWLDPQVPFAQIIGPALRAAEAHAKEHLHIYEVAPLVSQMKNDSPECMMPRKDYDAKTFSKGLGKFFAKKAAPDATPTPPSPPRETPEQETETPAKRPAPAEAAGADETAAPPAKVARTTASVPPSDASAALADTVILLDED